MLNEACRIYDVTGEIKATASEMGMNPIKVKKLLITCGRLDYDVTGQIQRLLAYGKSIAEISEETGLKKSSINSYLPYSKAVYNTEKTSANAGRCDLYRRRKYAVEHINDADSLVECLELFSGYKFSNDDGEFLYEKYGDELVIKSTGESKNIHLPVQMVIEVYSKISDADSQYKNYISTILDRFHL